MRCLEKDEAEKVLLELHAVKLVVTSVVTPLRIKS
jgi:hypothetical protein